MANQVASQNMLHAIGFSIAEADLIYAGQGINLTEELAVLDDESVSTWCKVFRQPGGTVDGGGADSGVMVSA